MPGVPGARPPLPKPNTVRRQLWQSMRILRRFTVPDLLRTIPPTVKGASYNNAGKFVSRLATHGYIAEVGKFRGGKHGEYRQYVMVKDVGPDYPVRCERCGEFITEPLCLREREKEKETERGAGK